MTTMERQPIGFVDVTLRDGEQQEKKFDVMPVDDRIAVFDQLVAAGITRVEIGHLGNEHDIEYAKALVPHIHAKSEAGYTPYEEVGLQVLFGTHDGLIGRGAEALGDFDKDRVTIHAYDRASPNLRNLTNNPYSTRESANRVVKTAMEAMKMGFTRFSISGEGTVDPDLSVKAAADEFYLPIVSMLAKAGAESINVNLPNTFGSSTDEVGEWSKKGLKKFNHRIKRRFPATTTSIHTHNDYGSGVQNTLDALEADFDSVEGALIGMGERSGNVALVDVVARMLENARMVVEARDRNVQKGRITRTIGEVAIRRKSIWTKRYIEQKIVDNLDHWYESAQAMSETYDTNDRFAKTSLGNTDAYSAGCGPHAGGNEWALRMPDKRPLWRNYGRVAMVHWIMGRPEATKVIQIDRAQYRRMSLPTHAAGGATKRVNGEEIPECDEETRQYAFEIAELEKHKIVKTISE